MFKTKSVFLLRSVFFADKYGVRVSSELQIEDGKIHWCVEGAEVHELKLFVENTGQEAILFTCFSALHYLQYFTLVDSQRVTNDNPHRLEPSESIQTV